MANAPHVEQSYRGKHDGVGRIHDGRTQQHAHRIQVISGAGHDVAGACALVVGIRKPFQVFEQVVAQIKFDLAGNPNQLPAGQKLKNAFGYGNRDQYQGIEDELVAGYTLLNVIHGVSHLKRELRPNEVGANHGESAEHESPAVAPEVRFQRAQMLEH